MNPKISVIVPAFNAEKTIGRCVNSVLLQSYKNIELIIVNDGSTDATSDICTSFLYDDRIVLINKENEGVSSARNTGLDVSTGTYILFVDSDDVLMDGACERYVCTMESGADWCIADFQRIRNGKTESQGNLTNIVKSGVYQKFDLLRSFGVLYKNHYINTPCGKCYRRDKVTGCFSTETSIGEDLLFNLEYLLNCETIIVLNEPLYQYCIQDNGSLSSSFKMEYFGMLQYVYERTQTYCGRLGLVIPNSEIDEKYVLDMIAIFERLARNNWDATVPKLLRTIYFDLSLATVFDRTQMFSDCKIEIEKRLLQNQRFGLFCVFTRSIFAIKRCTRLWIEHVDRKN